MLTKTDYKKNYSSIILKAALLIITPLIAFGCGPGFDIENPYDMVDWEHHYQYKANFHTHTTISDGRLNPHTVVDKYYQLGYDILAITDHNAVSYPWTEFSNMEPGGTTLRRMENEPETMPAELVFEDRDPIELGMIDIQANELSRHHHMGSFFNDHNNTTTEEESVEAVGAKDGIVMLYHPGRYDFTYDWYVELYSKYDHLFGLEVYNQGDRYPEDRKIWDSILSVTMPERPVWGYSNDDMHTSQQIGRNWNILILPELNHDMVRHGMENGLSYFIYAPQGHDGPAAPVIEKVKVNSRRGEIKISASDYDSIIWISKGEILKNGNIINLRNINEDVNYVRAEIHGPGEIITGTQPFGIKR